MTVISSRTSSGARVRWRVVVVALGAAVSALTLMDQFGWQSPKREHVAIHAEIAALDRRVTRTDSTAGYAVGLLESLSKMSCLKATPIERVRSGLPCARLLRDAMSNVPTERGTRE